VLQSVLERGPERPRVAVVSIDGFLLPNRVLAARGLLDHKGFPETYDVPALVAFLGEVRAGARDVRVPVYSHERYDVLAERQPLQDPGVVVLEGLHVLSRDVADLVDFGVYIDAAEADIEAWFVARLRALCLEAATDEGSFFRPFVGMSDAELAAFGHHVWDEINAVNLHEHILPTRERADVVLEKGPDHLVRRVELRVG
jgi:type I pantothenate kinase